LRVPELLVVEHPEVLQRIEQIWMVLTAQLLGGLQGLAIQGFRLRGAPLRPDHVAEVREGDDDAPVARGCALGDLDRPAERGLRRVVLAIAVGPIARVNQLTPGGPLRIRHGLAVRRRLARRSRLHPLAALDLGPGDSRRKHQESGQGRERHRSTLHPPSFLVLSRHQLSPGAPLAAGA
jgi:hypothetical protein